jgi:hypothetical protein
LSEDAQQDDVLALVQSSPSFVARQDKAGWREIFSPDFVIEDPVGSLPVRVDGIDRFWDTFIAPNRIEFEVHHDWIEDLVVVRDVTIRITLRPGVVVHTPAILRYECARDGDRLRVVHMSAFWESVPVFAQMLRPSPGHLAALTAMSMRMLLRLGLRATLQLAWAARPTRRRTKQALATQLGLADARKLVVAGGRVAACGTRAGRPAAVLAILDPRSGRVTGAHVYADLAAS